MTSRNRDLPDLIDEPNDGDRPSVTETGGSVARFDMSYSPPQGGEKVKFPAPLRARLPSLVYLAFALTIAGAVFGAYWFLGSGSWLFRFVVEGDRGRPVGSQVLAAIVLASAVGTVVRAQMRGVVVSADWIEARYLLALGIPKARKWGWPQVHRVVLDEAPRAAGGEPTVTAIGLEMYDGSFERLPDVSEPKKLRDHLLYYATKRRIEVTSLGSR